MNWSFTEFHVYYLKLIIGYRTGQEVGLGGGRYGGVGGAQRGKERSDMHRSLTHTGDWQSITYQYSL